MMPEFRIAVTNHLYLDGFDTVAIVCHV